LTWLLDTNVISEATRQSPSQAVLHWMGVQPVDQQFTASLALAELAHGIDRLADPARQAELRRWLEQRVRPYFAGRVLDADEAVWRAMMLVLARARSARRTVPIADLLLAACAERHGLIVVTRNTKDFRGTGVRVLDPWMQGAEPTIA